MSQDWWFVQKNLTQEKGWVPAVYLRDEPSYTLYVQKKLHEKIDKLPIFESKNKSIHFLFYCKMNYSISLFVEIAGL